MLCGSPTLRRRLRSRCQTVEQLLNEMFTPIDRMDQAKAHGIQWVKLASAKAPAANGKIFEGR